MKILTSNCFKDSSGFAFEDLICHFLQEEYGNIFKHTGYTNDGGKDFETTDDRVLTNGKTWAECKKYTKSLSYDNVSKTLLMAYVREINKILIFSYSPVNNRFYRNIAEYKQSTHIDVEVYDDEKLEKLLLKYKNKEWFGQYIDLSQVADISQMPSTSDSKVECSYNLSNRKKYQKQSRSISIDMYEIITLDLLLINRSVKNVTVNIDYSEFKKHTEFELLNKNSLQATGTKKYCIKKCSSQLVKLYVRIVKYQPSYQIPQICIDGKNYRIKDTLHATWLATTGLLGTVYRDYKDEIIKKCTYVQKLLFIAVEGETGTGKSKFLKELYHVMHNGKYKCFYCDIDTKKITVKILCREFFSMFTNLPYFKVSKKKISNLSLVSKSNSAFELASQILYNNKFDYSQNIDVIAACIFDFLRKSPFFIIIDNIQKYDALSLDIIRRLIELSSTQTCGSVLVISFNTNYLASGTLACDLRDYIKILNYHKQQRFYVVNLPGFDKIAAEEFIHNCLQIPLKEASDYKRVISQIIGRIGTNPLVLQNYLIYLYRLHIASIGSEHFTIIDLEKFIGNVDELEGNFDHLMDEIEQSIFETLNTHAEHTKAYLHLVGCLSLFRQLNRKIVDVMDENHTIIDCLIQYGVIQYDTTDSYYRFRHMEYLRYYWNKYNLRYIQHKQALSCINMSVFRMQYIECIFLLEFELEEIEPEIFNKIEDRILENRIVYDYLERVYNHVLQLYYVGFEGPSEKHLQVMKSLALTGMHLLGITKTISISEKIFDLLSEHRKYFSLNTPIIIDIFKEFLHHLMNEGMISKAEEYCQKMKDMRKDIPEAVSQKYMSELLKEEILIYYKQGKKGCAEKVVKNLLKNTKTKSFEYAECLMFWGNIYYRSEDFQNSQSFISQHWRDAYSEIQVFVPKYEKLDYRIRSIILNIVIKNSLVDIFEYGEINQYDRQFLKQMKNHTNMTYFEVKIRQLLSLEHLMNPSRKKGVGNALKMLKETLDILSTNYGNKALYTISLFFLAELHKALKEYDAMYDYFLNFYGVFMQLYSYDNQRNNDYYLLTEMCNSLRKYREQYSQTFNVNILNTLRNRTIFNRLKRILCMSDDEFSTYYRNNSKVSLFFCKSTDTNYPMI